MPRISSLIPTKELTLPSGTKVTVATKMSFGDSKAISLAANDTEAAALTVERVIKSWDLCDDNDEVVPITQENVELLPAEDVTVLVEEVTKLADATIQKEESK